MTGEGRELARFNGYHGLVAAIRARKNELCMSDSDLDDLCGWAAGTCAKYLAKGGDKIIGKLSMGKLLRNTGTYVVLVEDRAETDRVRATITPRQDRHVRGLKDDMLPDGKHILLSRRFMQDIARKGGKARAEKLSPRRRAAIARKGARARWRAPKLVEICRA